MIVYMEKFVRNKCYVVKMQFLDWLQQRSWLQKFLPIFHRSLVPVLI